jgi:hypothetical protein
MVDIENPDNMDAIVWRVKMKLWYHIKNESSIEIIQCCE